MASESADFFDGNLLLGCLPPEEAGVLAEHMQTIDLPARRVLYRLEDRIDTVYFPVAGIVSLVTTTLEGATVEMAMVGAEGAVGLPIMTDKMGQATNEAIAQVEGAALRIPLRDFTPALRTLPRFAQAIQDLSSALFALVSQNAACNRLHNMDQRLARWLLMCRDRVDRDEFALTQEFLGQMLGVRQASVSEAAAGLATQDIIRYHRGIITLLDPPRLEASACECYRRIRTLFDHLYK